MKRYRLILLAGALSIGVIGLHLWSLLRYPAPFVDEAWYASRAWAFIATGKPFGVLDAGVFDRFPGYGSYFQWLPVAIQSIALRLAGHPELFPLRVVSLAFGVVLLAAVWLIGQYLGGRRLAFLSTLLVALSQPFFYSAHMARYDVMVAALGFLSVSLMLVNSKRRARVALVAGLVLAMSFEIHPNGMIYGPVILVVGLAQWGWSYFGGRDFWAFAGATLLGLLGYFAIHILPNPHTYFALNHLIYGSTHVPPIATGSLSILAAGMGNELSLLLSTYLLGFVLVIWAAIALARSERRRERLLFLVALVLFLGQVLLVRNEFTYYAILVTPGLDMVLAAFLLRMTRSMASMRLAHPIPMVLSSLMMLGSMVVNLLPLRWNAYQDYLRVQDRINADVRPEDVIMASQTYWFGLYQHRYYSWEQLVYFERYSPGSGLEDGMAEFRPDIFIVDSNIEGFTTDEGQSGLFSGFFDIPKAELNEALAEHGRLIDQFGGGSHGQIRVYRLSWPNSPPDSQLGEFSRSGTTLTPTSKRPVERSDTAGVQGTGRPRVG